MKYVAPFLVVFLASTFCIHEAKAEPTTADWVEYMKALENFEAAKARVDELSRLLTVEPMFDGVDGDSTRKSRASAERKVQAAALVLAGARAKLGRSSEPALVAYLAAVEKLNEATYHFNDLDRLSIVEPAFDYGQDAESTVRAKAEAFERLKTAKRHRDELLAQLKLEHRTKDLTALGIGRDCGPRYTRLALLTKRPGSR